MSLKENLIEYLQRNKRLDLNQLYSLCGREMRKTSNGERRLREMMQPDHPSYNSCIRAEKNAKGAITAYLWQEYHPLEKELYNTYQKAVAPPQTEVARAFLSQWKPVEKKEVNTLF
jgi:hypothetical protein